MSVDFSTFLKGLGIGGNSPVTQPQVQQTQTQPKQSLFSSFMGGLKKAGGAVLNEFNRQQDAKQQMGTDIFNGIKQGASNYVTNLKTIANPETQSQVTTTSANPSALESATQFIQNRVVAPVAQIPYNVGKTVEGIKQKDLGKTAMGALGTLGGAANIIPGGQVINFLGFPLYDLWKSLKKEQQSHPIGPKDYISPESISAITGQKTTGLGEALTKNKAGQLVGNIAELPLMIGLFHKNAADEALANTIRNAEPEILSTIRNIKHYDEYGSEAQMNILQQVTDTLKLVGKDFTKEKVFKDLALQSPSKWMEEVSKFLQDRLAYISKPELKMGLSVKEYKRLPDNVIESAKPMEEVATAAKDIGNAPVPPAGPDLGPGMKERGLITSVKESPDTSAAVKATVEGNYPVITNEATKIAAEKAVAENPVAARDLVMGDKFDADVSAQGITLAKQLDLQGKTAEADAIWERLAEKATTAGQGNQALSMLGAASPKVMENFAIKAINQANEARSGIVNKLFGTKKIEFTEQLQKDINELMLKARGLSEGEAKNAVISQVLERIGKDIPPTASELIDAYRYNNMLSNPNTWGPTGRNMWYNLGQTFFIKPATMAFEAVNDVILSTLTGKARETYISDVPKYYKAVFNSIPEAAQASLDILSGKSPLKHPDLSETTQRQLYDLLRETRQKNIPGNLDIIFGPKGEKLNAKNAGEAGKYVFTKMFSNLMEMNDRAFSTLIAAGERAVQESKGVPEAEAKQAADAISQYFLGRSRVDPMNKSGQGKLLSAIDSLEAWVASGRKHGPIKWMIPFINMATQTAKQTIEYSPAGLLTLWGNTSKGKQLAKAELGTAATMISTLLVASNNVTWAAPSDPKERDLFFASGRKPYSIKIGDAWVPINTFGPLSLSIGTVAAWKYYHDQDPEKYTTTEYEKVRKTLTGQLARFGEQPMIQGLTNIAKALNGVMGKDAASEATLPSSAAFTAGQTIPLNGLLRYISQVLDPVFRSVKGEGFIGSLQKDLPGLSKNLLPYLDPSGEPSKRNITDFASPYAMGFSNKTYDEIYQRIQSSKQIKGISSSAKSEINAIKGRIEIIAKDKSLNDADRQAKLDVELQKIKNITGELEKNYQKVGPMVQPQ